MITLKELWIDGFGCLRTGDEPLRFAQDRINLFLDDNETGKTTLQMALLACLYGVEHDRRLLRTSLRPHHDHWFPFGGEPFGARLRLEADSRPLEVRWNFETNECHVVDLRDNRDVTDEFAPGNDNTQLGHRLLGLTLEEFIKTALVRQDDLRAVREAEGLDQLVQRFADTTTGDTTVAAAREVLRTALDRYPGITLKEGGKVENEIKRLRERIAELQGRLDELEAARAAVADDEAEYQRLCSLRDQARHRVAELEYLAHDAELTELRNQIADAQKRAERLAKLRAEAEQLAEVAEFPADEADNLTAWQVEFVAATGNAEQALAECQRIQTLTIAPAQQELQAMGRLAEVADSDLNALTELLGRTADFEKREEQLNERIVNEEHQLEASGASIEELDRLEKRFANLQPDDGQFLTDYERAAARAQSERAELEKRHAEASARIEEIKQQRLAAHDQARRLLLVGCALGAAAVVLGIGLAFVSLWAALAVGLALAAAGVATALKARADATRAEQLRAQELEAAKTTLAELEKTLEEQAEQERQRRERVKALAHQFDYEQPEVLLEDHATLDSLRRQCGTLIDLRKRLPELQAERAEIEAQVEALFRSYGLERPADIPLSAALRQLQKRVQRALELRRTIAEATRTLEKQRQEHQKQSRKAEELEERIYALFERAGVGRPDSVEEGITLFNQRLNRHKRYKQLTTELIPQLEATVPAPAQLEAMTAQAERLHRIVANLREERPEVVALEVTNTAAEYRHLLDQAAQEAEQLRQQADQLGAKVIGVLERYNAEKPQLQAEIETLRSHLEKASRHKEAIELAIEVLEEIGKEVHGRWADELNNATSRFLGRIAPTLSDLRFDSNLRFGVWHTSAGFPIRSTETSPVLSSGTWDQLYLAVRLGLCHFMARRGNATILVLDDPFAHFDDPRFKAAVELLAELARENFQILIFSCQRQRFLWLEASEPRWFAANVACQRIAPIRR